MSDLLNGNPTACTSKFICSVCDKRDKFKLSVVRLTPRFSNQSDNVGNIALLPRKLLGLIGSI